MLSYNGALETADPLHIVEGSPRAVDGGNTMVKTEWGVRSDEVEEESPVYTNELESITADVVPRTRMPTVQEVLGDINPAAAHEDKEGEEKEPSIRQLTPAQDVADEPTDENKSSCHEEPAPIQNTVDKAVESKNKEEEREPSSQQCASVPATVDNVIDEEEEKGENEQQSLIRPSVDESIEEQEEQEIEPRDEQLDEMVEGKEHEGNEVSIEQPASMQDSADEVLDENETEENGEASDQHPAEVVEGKDLSGNHSARIQATTDDAIETEENNLSDQQSRVAVDDKDIETVEHEQIEKNGPKSSQPAPTRDTADEMVEDEREKESGPSTEKSDVLVEVAKAEENEPSDDQSAVMQDTTNYEVEEDVQATDDEVVEEEKGEEDESISGQPEPMTGEPIYDQIEEMVENNEGNEANSLRSASFSDTTTDEETDEVYQVRLEPSSVALLIQRLGSDQVPAQQQEDTLLDLLGTDDQKEEAARALEHLVVKSDTTVDTFISDRIKTQLMGYFTADAILQRADVAAAVALDTLGAVLEGAALDSDEENESNTHHKVQDSSADPKEANNPRTLGAVLEGAALDSDEENESNTHHKSQDPSADPKEANSPHIIAGAW
ncbi:uncharacterized protein IUM83_17015 [Phytophthora cinnamomi]|uniref:uncharacterized protein n=1 Tax=Phytophthora cinnamomi TaxID=4785 RepID=UPI003559A996|nr:hypothetical protein IUM83_17015 [Phytophthora cinnamomi]